MDGVRYENHRSNPLGPDHGHDAQPSRGDHTARLWDLKTGENVTTFALQSQIAADRSFVRGGVSAVVFSPDGKMLAVSSTLGVVHLVSPETGAVLHTLTPPTATPP